MKLEHWTKFVDFIFWLLSYVKCVVVKLYRFVMALWAPIHVKVKPDATKLIDWFNGRKTYVVSLFSIVALCLGYWEGSVTLSSLLSTLPCLVVAMTIRHGMARDAVPKVEGGTK